MIRFIFLFLLLGRAVFAVDPVFDAANVNRVRDEGVNGSGSHFPNLEVNDRTLLSSVIMGTETDVNKLQHIDGEQRSKLQSMVSVGTIGANPTTVGSLVQWVRSDLGVTLNGSTLSAWADQSGAGHHFVQATADKQPTLLSNQINLQSVVSFDGTNDVMSCAGFALSQPYTIATVNKTRRNTGGPVTWGGATVYLYQLLAGWRIGGTLFVDSAAAPYNHFYMVIGIFNGASSKIYRNNDAAVTGDVGTDGFSGDSIGNFFGGADLYCEQTDIAEELVYNKALTASEVATVRLYLNNRYGTF